MGKEKRFPAETLDLRRRPRGRLGAVWLHPWGARPARPDSRPGKASWVLGEASPRRRTLRCVPLHLRRPLRDLHREVREADRPPQRAARAPGQPTLQTTMRPPNFLSF